ncbi:receptor-like protein 6 [Salvia hispanica]|uniref:receptor-like protein 6 n=1 Tax=Salvia hispanica TaxID=49212 RepID=UPI002009682F|nr:receptor-like protein 6 [Salvia hispanica]
MLLNLLFFICTLISSFIFTAHCYSNKCLRHQEILLVQLRDEMIFNSSLSTKLVRWNESGECCKWPGVECDASGYVVSLQLDGEALSGGIGDSSSLFRFKYLQKLNLAYNYFNDAIPKGIGNFTYLTHLNLSYVGFGGHVPSEILTLTRLASLDISNNFGEISFEHPNLEMLVQNLTELRELYLDGVDITSLHERKNWGHILSSHLPNLTSLSMVGCFLCAPSPKSFWQLHSLSILRLDHNDLSGITLHDLFTNFPSLATLTLSSCSLNGSIPSTFANLTKLIHVDLSYNSFTGSLPSTLFANLTKLIHVDLSENSLTGLLPSSFFEGVSNLVHLDLSKNSFSGNIPHSLYALPSLLELDLSYNRFNDTFQLDNFQSLPNLTWLGLSGNSLSVDIDNFNSSSSSGLQLKLLHLASCNLSHFPDFIKDLDLLELDLSANSIAGEIPSWIWGTQLWYLNLSLNLLTDFQKPYNIPASLESLLLDSNQLRGELQLPIPLESQLNYLSVANNSLRGSIPTSLCKATHLDSLDLFGNKLSGSIPPCLLQTIRWLDLNQNSLLITMDIGNNNISGNIPDIFPMDCRLNYLVLSNNNLEGMIPKSIKSCMSLEIMDVGNNNINDTFPCMLSFSLSVLILHSNRFHGEVTCNMTLSLLRILDISLNDFSGRLQSINFSSWRGMMDWSDAESYGVGVTLIMKGIELKLKKIWPEFGSIDFSCNNFIGEIPKAIGDLTSLHHLNLSHNALNGNIPQSFGNMSKLESLDLSRNQLAGRIPMGLGELTFLEVLNLSYNKLVGMIPNGRQIQTFSAKSFEGNPGLCGFPLNKNCSHTNELSSRGHEDVEEKREIEWEYVSAALGYVVGFGSIVWLLLFCRSFREKYFSKIEEVVEDIFIARDMRRRRARMIARNRVRRH